MDIGPVNLSDNGQIKCTLMNRFGREDAIAQLFVVGKRTIQLSDEQLAICFRSTVEIIVRNQRFTSDCQLVS